MPTRGAGSAAALRGAANLASLREYLAALKEIGELVEIDREVDWNLEIGAIIRRCYETGAPAPLFTRIVGIEPGFRVFGAPAGVSRQPELYMAAYCALAGTRPASLRARDARGARRRQEEARASPSAGVLRPVQRECPAP